MRGGREGGEGEKEKRMRRVGCRGHPVDDDSQCEVQYKVDLEKFFSPLLENTVIFVLSTWIIQEEEGDVSFARSFMLRFASCKRKGREEKNPETYRESEWHGSIISLSYNTLTINETHIHRGHTRGSCRWSRSRFDEIVPRLVERGSSFNGASETNERHILSLFLAQEGESIAESGE